MTARFVKVTLAQEKKGGHDSHNKMFLDFKKWVKSIQTMSYTGDKI